MCLLLGFHGETEVKGNDHSGITWGLYMDFGGIVGKGYAVGRRKFYLGGNIYFLGQSLLNSPFSDEVLLSTMEPGEEIGGKMSWSIIFSNRDENDNTFSETNIYLKSGRRIH